MPAPTSYNSGHTAPLRSTQIRQSRTSYVRKTLSAIRRLTVGKGGRKFMTLLPERLDIIRCIDSDKKSHMEVVEG